MAYVTRSLLAAAGLLVLSQGQAAATEYPYCMTSVEAFGGGVERCDYTTMEQCRMSASGVSGSCAPNWRFGLNRAQGANMVDPGAPRKRYLR